MAPINFCLQLVAGEANLLRINDYDVIAAIEVRSEIGLVFSDQHSSNRRCQPPEHLPSGIYNHPVGALHQVFGFSAPRYMRRHLLSHTFPSMDKPQP